MSNRRDFLKQLGLGTAGLMTLNSFEWANLLEDRGLTTLTILHTNDMHSHIDPFPADHRKYPGMGGMARRASLIAQIRKEKEHVLLVDAGDIFQGTPYFNYYGGEVEFKLMNQMQYDCATMGNHDFDNGLEGFNKMLPHANFPFVCSNYDFTDTLLEGKTHLYKVFKKGPIKIGVFGIGIELEGLVNEPLFSGVKHLDPIERANHWAKHLKHEEKCDLVICLSHLGFEYKSQRISDKRLAQSTTNIDCIIGGHTHTFLDIPVEIVNKEGNKVMVNQAGWAGLRLGQIDFIFDRESGKKLTRDTALLYSKNRARKIG